MDNLLIALQDPVLQRALVGGLVGGLLLSFFGIFVLLRRMAFIGEGIAHASLSAIAAAIIIGYSPFLLAILFGIVFAAILFFLERKTIIHSDALIGILFPASLSLGAILLSLRGIEEADFEEILFGDIFSIQSSELTIAIIAGVIALAFLARWYRKLIFSSLDREGAEVVGINTNAIDFIFYVLLAVVIVLGAKMLGILMVSALLVIPSSLGKLIAGSMRSMAIISSVFAECAVVAGILISSIFHLPAGATIILLGAALFFMVFAATKALGFKNI